MTITIEFEKILVNNEKLVKFTKLRALTKKDLPLVYLNYGPSLRMSESGQLKNRALIIKRKDSTQILLKEGDTMFLSDFDKVLCLVYEAGERLKKINERLKKESRAYSGKEKIVI